MDKILVLDFGGQYDQLIARRVREQHVYAEIVPYNRISTSDIKNSEYKGIIFTGGPNSVYEKDSPKIDSEILNIDIPILGICYGAQLMTYLANGKVSSNDEYREYGKIVFHKKDSILFEGLPECSICWMSHSDYISEIPDGFSNIACSDHCPNVAIENKEKKLYGVQFHPEVLHTEYGKQIFANFLFRICELNRDWQMEDFIDRSVKEYQKKLTGKKVLLALSGGVDSAVAAVLLNKAISKDLICVFVDHGLLRKNEADEIEKLFLVQAGILKALFLIEVIIQRLNYVSIVTVNNRVFIEYPFFFSNVVCSEFSCFADDPFKQMFVNLLQ